MWKFGNLGTWDIEVRLGSDLSRCFRLCFRLRIFPIFAEHCEVRDSRWRLG